MQNRRWTVWTTAVAVMLGLATPYAADAQVRERKTRARITNAERKAAADARKAKMAEAQRRNPTVKYQHATPPAKPAAADARPAGGAR